jgi:HEAT repeats
MLRPRFAVLACVFAVFMTASRRADAGKVDELVTQLASAPDYKVRLSAALTLAKLGDDAAIPAFVGALSDVNKTVRGVAAASLGKIIDSTTRPAVRKRAIVALETAAKRDSNAFVRKQAQKALDALGALRETGAAPVSTGGIYINVGSMEAETDDSARMRKLMRRTTLEVLSKRAPRMMTAWPGAGEPSRRQLRAKNVNAFYVDGTLNKLDVRSQGASTLVSCKVSMLLATYPERSMFGFLSGGAKVQAGSSPREIQYAKDDCVSAVVDSLIASKVIPAIRTRAR